MTTDVLDENGFESQCSLYETTHVQLTNNALRDPTTASTVLDTSLAPKTPHNQTVKYSTQTNSPPTHSLTNSIHSRHSGSSDILSLIRSFAMKPFKTSSMTNALAGGQTSNVIGGGHIRNKPPVNLLRYRPLSDVLTDQTSYTQSTHVCIEKENVPTYMDI